MAIGDPRRKFEFGLLAVLVCLLLLVLLSALESVRKDVEEAAVQGEAAALRVELLDILAHREVQGGSLPSGRNPVQWTGRAPADYVGELDASPGTVGIWYFNRREGILAYRYRRGGEARFRLAVGNDGRKTRGTLAGVGLVRLENEKSN